MAIKIPRYDSPTVEPGAMPTPHMMGATPVAFGAGIAKEFDEIAKKEIAKANTAAVLNARIALNGFEQNAYYGDNTKDGQGVLKKRGLAAAKDEQIILKNFKTWAEDYEKKNLFGSEQKLAFKAMVGERLMSMQETLARHSRKELEWHNDETLKATEQSSFDRIGMLYDQPDQIEKEIAIIKFARSNRLDQEGIGTDPESATIRANYLKDVESKARSLVVSKMMDNGQFMGAKEYLAKHKDDMNVDDYDKTERALKPLSDAQSGTEAATRLFDANPDGNIAEAMKKLRAELKDNPSALKHGESELKSMFSERRMAKEQEADEAEAAVYAKLARGERPSNSELVRLSKADPKRLTQILEREQDRAERAADRAERRADRLERRSERENGNQLLNWSSLVQDPASLIKVNLDKLYVNGQISKQGYADLSRRRGEIINNPAKEQAIRSKSDAVNGILKAAGLKAGTDEHNRAWQVVENIMRTKEKPTYDDTLNAARLAVREVPRPGRDKPLWKMGVSDVPVEEQTKIRADFRKRLRRDPTAGEITYYYGMKQLKGK